MLFVNKEDRSVGFEINSFGPFDDLETFDGNVLFVGQAEPNYVEHC